MASNVYKTIKISKAKGNDLEYLYAGDSVANQLFFDKNKNDKFRSVACNQGIEMVGYYLLILNTVNNVKKVDNIILLAHPLGLTKTLDKKYTFNYFLKPFYTKEYYKHFTAEVKSKIRNIPYSVLACMSVTKIFNFSPNVQLRQNKAVISKIAIDYLRKISLLAKKNGIKFVFIAPPISNESRSEVEELEENSRELINNAPELKMYFESISYLPAKYYSDKIHFGTNGIEKVKNSIMKKIKKICASNDLRIGDPVNNSM
jgi:hypothetical protein